MTVFSDDLTKRASDLLSAAWNIRDGQVVPETEDVTLKNGGVKVEATYLYADLAGSSDLAQKLKREVAAKVIRSYISAASSILLRYEGAIRSFDGDRVMAIFIGGSKNTNAVRAGLAINWAVQQMLWPNIRKQWPTITDYYTMNHGVGVATGEALIVRGGVRDNNDLISVGSAPNLAAKLSELRTVKELYIDSTVYHGMHDRVKYKDEATRDTHMWSNYGTVAVGGTSYTVYYSSYYWQP